MKKNELRLSTRNKIPFNKIRQNYMSRLSRSNMKYNLVHNMNLFLISVWNIYIQKYMNYLLYYEFMLKLNSN